MIRPRHRRLVDRHVATRRRLFASRLVGRVFVRQSILRGRRALRAGSCTLCKGRDSERERACRVPAASAALSRRPFRATPGVSCGRLGQARIDRIRSRGVAMAHLARLKAVGELELASGGRSSRRCRRAGSTENAPAMTGAFSRRDCVAIAVTYNAKSWACRAACPPSWICMSATLSLLTVGSTTVSLAVE